MAHPEWPTPSTLAFMENVTEAVTAVPGLDVNGTNGSYPNFTGSYDYACFFLMDPPSLMLSHKVYLYSSLVCMVLGLVGNALSMIVFSAQDMRIVSSNVYLLVLAISDSSYLLSVFFSKNLTYLRCLFFLESAFDIYNRSAFFCKFLQYLQDLFSSYSTCVILAFTLERYVAVYQPVKFKELCTVRRARILCLTIFLVIAVFILPYHMLYMEHYSRFNVCTVLMTHEQTFTILYAIEAFIFRIVPVILITVLNVYIIVRVTSVTKQRRRQSSACYNNNRNGSKRGRRSIRDDRSLQLTVMLILVSTTYVLTYIPVLVHFVMWKLQRSELVVVNDDNMLIARNYTCALYIAGFAINFFLYTMSGRVFREQLDMLLCGHRQDKYKGVRNGAYTGMATSGGTEV